jgi:low affinity Fe/Cu permease
MKRKKESKLTLLFERISAVATRKSGSPATFIIALTLVIAWLVTGPLFGFSDTWQLVINTGTTIITFLMVFLIQQSQNKDVVAIHLKLNELIASNQLASNRLIDVEDLTDAELAVLKNFYIRLSQLTKKERNLFATHSLDEAQLKHEKKVK